MILHMGFDLDSACHMGGGATESALSPGTLLPLPHLLLPPASTAPVADQPPERYCDLHSSLASLRMRPPASPFCQLPSLLPPPIPLWGIALLGAHSQCITSHSLRICSLGTWNTQQISALPLPWAPHWSAWHNEKVSKEKDWNFLVD